MAVNHMKQNSTLSAYAEPMHYDLKELLVGYDFSAAADSALKYAVMLSKRFGSFIHLIGVQSPADYAGAVEAGPVAMEMSQRDLQFGLQEIQESLRAKGIWTDSVREEWATELRDRGVKVTWTVLYGQADTTLAQHATESKASLILFGLHRRGNQMIDCPEAVVGGTIRQAPCPVMTVPRVLMNMR